MYICPAEAYCCTILVSKFVLVLLKLFFFSNCRLLILFCIGMTFLIFQYYVADLTARYLLVISYYYMVVVMYLLYTKCTTPPVVVFKKQLL